LYSRNVIEFQGFTSSNIVSFNLDGLPLHKKVIVRARVSTTCTSMQDQSLSMTLSGTPDIVTTIILT